MPFRLSPWPCVVLGLCGSCVAGPATRPAAAATQSAPAFDPARHMRTSEVRPGMTGYGLSVFRGTAIDRFDVEVVSVLRNQDGPNHNIVLIRCRGQGLEHSGAVEGMSGSPIYLTDAEGHSRMIGAFALGWEYSKDPIAGVRPIEEMLDVPTAPTTLPADAMASAGVTWNATPMLAAAARPTPDRLAATNVDTLRLRPLALPLTVAGLNAEGFARVAPWLAVGGLHPLQSGATTAATTAAAGARLEPGATIVLPIVTGDLDLAAVGTVTEVLGDRVYAFGHEYNAEGGVDLPMGVGYVHTVIPASNISFKIGSLLHLDGTIASDESVGIAGTVGRVPAMIPVTVRVTTPQRPDPQTYRFNVARHPKLTPMGVVTSLLGAITGHSGLPTDFTVNYTMRIAFDNGRTLDLADTATSATQAATLARDVNLPMTLALLNPFRRTYPTELSATFTITPTAELAELKSVVPDKTVYRPGDTVRLFVTTVDRHGGEQGRQVTLDLPDDQAEGTYALTVGDADRYTADEMRDAPYRFQVRTLDEVFGLITEMTKRPSKQLYVRLAAQTPGVSVGRTPLRGMPASKLRVLSRPGRSDVMPYVPSVGRAFAWDVPVHGSTDLELVVSNTPGKTVRPTRTPPTFTPQLPEQVPNMPAAKND